MNSFPKDYIRGVYNIDIVNGKKLDTRSAEIAEGSPKMGSVRAGIARSGVAKCATVGLSRKGPVCSSPVDPGIVITGVINGVAGKQVDPRSERRSSVPVGTAPTSSKSYRFDCGDRPISKSLDIGGDDTIDAVVTDSSFVWCGFVVYRTVGLSMFNLAQSMSLWWEACILQPDYCCTFIRQIGLTALVSFLLQAECFEC